MSKINKNNIINNNITNISNDDSNNVEDTKIHDDKILNINDNDDKTIITLNNNGITQINKDNMNIINKNDINIIDKQKNDNINIINDFNNINGDNDLIQNINENNIQNFFPLVGLKNLGSTCFMNAIIQCLLHISELSFYFLKEYPKDKSNLNTKNILSETKGNLSEAYYQLIKDINNLSQNNNNKSSKYYSPNNFKNIIGDYNPQFKKNEANDSKDLIVYLLQTFHAELNYLGDINAPNNIQFPDSSIRINIYNYFCLVYNSTNFSKISQLFYGTYETVITCSECKTNFYSFQKFEIISFSTYKYKNKEFDIMNGFRDMEKVNKLEGDNQYFCCKCNKLVNAETFYKILEPPIKLILNIDYGKNKINNVNQVIFDMEIDIKNYLSFYYGQKTKYRLCSVCTHKGKSG